MREGGQGANALNEQDFYGDKCCVCGVADDEEAVVCANYDGKWAEGSAGPQGRRDAGATAESALCCGFRLQSGVPPGLLETNIDTSRGSTDQLALHRLHCSSEGQQRKCHI